MGTAILGRSFDLKIDASIVASATKFSISPKRDMIEIATLSSSRAKVYIPDMYGYTLTADGLVFRSEPSTYKGYFDIINTMINTDVSVSWTGLPDTSTTKYYSGWGYISSCPFDAAVGGVATYSLEIQGCGDITISTTA